MKKQFQVTHQIPLAPLPPPTCYDFTTVEYSTAIATG